MILIIDSYDSFTYNLYQLVGSLNPDLKVVRNDALTVEEVRALAPTAIILSPGPGRPSDAGIIIEVVKQLGGDIPILGVCLGHQAICEAFGGTITYADQLMHGKQSVAYLDEDCMLFEGLGKETPVARYHSLALAPDSLPEVLKITAQTASGEIMAVAHRTKPIYGVQFHPESILTPQGMTMLTHFLNFAQHYQGGQHD